jgi:hypothetical protein
VMAWNASRRNPAAGDPSTLVRGGILSRPIINHRPQPSPMRGVKATMRIPAGWLKHPELSHDDHVVIVPDPTYFGARADPPPAWPGWVWRYFVPCNGYRLAREGSTTAYEPDDFMAADKSTIWDALKEAAQK